MNSTRVPLYPESFIHAERVLLEVAPFKATGFLFPSGVEAVRLENGEGELVILPFQGQQIWSAIFDGRNLAQQSMFPKPNKTRTYLETYGAFLIHCGATAMGVAGPTDTHPLHGDLPNAPYQNAWISTGEDQRGRYISIGGSYQHTVAFNFNYLTEPEVRFYEGSSVMDVDISITNLKKTPMPFMYLAHINFRPVNGSELVYSAKCTPETVRVRASIPSHIHPPAGYREFLDELSKNPAMHNSIRAGQAYDPEVVFYIDYLKDESGWAHTLQVLPDGSADYAAHRPDELRKGVRWISRTPDQDALGMILPATAEPEGFSAEEKKGNVLSLGGGETYQIHMRMGVMKKNEVASTREVIDRLIRS